jgi:hypothetical protein
MPYIKQLELDQLPLPSDEAYWVKMKRKASYGDVLAAQSAMLQVTQGTNGSAGQVLTEMEWGAYLSTLTIRLLTEWNLTDASEAVLPITEASLESLQPEDGEFLAAEAQKRLGRRPTTEQIPFGKRSGRRSTNTR